MDVEPLGFLNSNANALVNEIRVFQGFALVQRRCDLDLNLYFFDHPVQDARHGGERFFIDIMQAYLEWRHIGRGDEVTEQSYRESKRSSPDIRDLAYLDHDDDLARMTEIVDHL